MNDEPMNDELMNDDSEAFEEDGEVFDVIVLEDDGTGEEVECVVLDRVEIKGSSYLLVVESAETETDEPNAIILKENRLSDTESTFLIVENDEEFQIVIDALEEKNSDFKFEL